MQETVQVPAIVVDVSLWLLGAVFQLAVMYGAFKLWQGDIAARLKQVEGHGVKVEKIGPIEAELEALKGSIGTEFKNLREDIRELARSVQQLAMQRSAP